MYHKALKTILPSDTKNGNSMTLLLNKIALGVVERRAIIRGVDNGLVFRDINGKRVNAQIL